MRCRILILGGGTGGTIIANRRRRTWTPDEAEITVVDREDAHLYQPGLLFVPFGLADFCAMLGSPSRRRGGLARGAEIVSLYQVAVLRRIANAAAAFRQAAYEGDLGSSSRCAGHAATLTTSGAVGSKR